ncbi:MAG TPA: thiamine phosphate synthase [Acidimicrobiales bacterium]|nr:thiamine phosphate synthase [Acidimicrobiales bacterium]
MSTPGSQRLVDRRLYLCTSDRPDLATFLASCIAGGVDVVQLRDKHLDARTLVERGRLAARVCAESSVPFILNDRPDLALEIEADGVHVGQDDAPPRLARRILGPTAVVGLSTHAPEELEASRDEPVDYVSAGPVTPTPTKPGRPGTGTSYITFAVAEARRPVFVTGGVTPESVPSMAAAGARHFVVVRYLTESDDPRRAAARLRAAIDRHVVGDGASEP